MNFEVRAARCEDAEALVRLNLDFNGSGGPDAESVEASIRENRQEIVILATANGQGAGFCCLRVARSMCYCEPAGEIAELYVDPRFRRRGLASGMIRLAEKLCLKQGATKIYLLTGGDNRSARAFYEKMGYRLDGEVHYGRALDQGQ